jgi:hydrogenase nickel incorporation protein HypA/HybF
MHEVSIVEALVEQVESEVRRAGHAGRVVRLSVGIGRLSGVNADSFRFAFEMIAPDTSLAGARLEIDLRPAFCRCSVCDALTPIEDLVPQCPACGSPQIRFEGGRELMLDSIEIEEEDGEGRMKDEG